jgi:hypothetical protein
MILHLSFSAHHPGHVASVLAELLGATVVDCPSPPFPLGSKYVCCFDEVGTMVEVTPSGTTLRPGHNGAPRAVAAPPTHESNGFHGLFSTHLSTDRIFEIARREDWPCSIVDTGRFKVVAVWVERFQLVELTNPELLADYRALWGPAGRETLNPFLRQTEALLRARS